jgi:hypothetical protein
MADKGCRFWPDPADTPPAHVPKTHTRRRAAVVYPYEPRQQANSDTEVLGPQRGFDRLRDVLLAQLIRVGSTPKVTPDVVLAARESNGE